MQLLIVNGILAGVFTFWQERGREMSQRKIAILSICAAWFAVLCAILLGVMIGKHLVVLVIFSAISAFFVTLTWAIRLRNSSVQ